MFALYGFNLENNFWKKLCTKNFNFEPFCYHIKMNTTVNKGHNLLNHYVLTVLLSIPFNKLPCVYIRNKHKTEIQESDLPPEQMEDCETKICRKLYGFNHQQLWCKGQEYSK